MESIDIGNFKEHVMICAGKYSLDIGLLILGVIVNSGLSSLKLSCHWFFYFLLTLTEHHHILQQPPETISPNISYGVNSFFETYLVIF